MRDAVLRWLAGESLATSILGDLDEERARRARDSRPQAALWFWAATFAVARFYLTDRVTAAVHALVSARGGGGAPEWRHAARALRRQPWYASALIGVIALTMTLATTVFAVVDGVLFKPLPFPKPDELVVIQPRHRSKAGLENRTSASPEDVSAWRAALPDVPIAAARTPNSVSIGNRIRLSQDLNSPQVPYAEVDSGFLGALGIEPLVGGFVPSSFQPSAPEVPRAALLTYGLWQSEFGGDSAAIGRVIPVSDSPRFSIQIVGVLPPSFVSPSPADAEVLLASAPPKRLNGLPDRRYDEVIARVPPGQSTDVVRQRIERAMPGAAALFDTEMLRMFPPFDSAIVIPIRTFVNAGQETIALAVFAAAVLLLILGGVNVSGLVAARSQQRAREVSVRRALGAGTWAIVRSVFAEVALVTFIGTAIGLGAARLALSITASLLPSQFHPLKPLAVDWRVATFAAVVSVLGAMLMTIAPARRALRGRVVLHLGDADTTTRRLSRGSRIGIAIQVGLGMTLAVGGSLVVGSLVRIWQEDVGFNRHVMAVSLFLNRTVPAGGAVDVASMLDRVRQVPGVEAAAVMDQFLLQGASRGYGQGIEGPASASEVWTENNPITAGFFEVMQSRLVAGRFPMSAELESGSAIAVSAATAQAFWPGVSAIGQTLKSQTDTFTVVGIVADARYAAWDQAVGVIYEPYSRLAGSRTPTLLVRGVAGADPPMADVLGAIATLGTWVRAVRVDRLDQLLSETIRPRRFDAWLFGAFAAGALLIVLTGLFGLIAMTAVRRTREVGIRMALGATREDVIGLLMREALAAVFAGIVGGGAMAAWSAPVLARTMYGFTVYDWRLWSAAAATLLLAACIGALVPAARASRLDPVRALRVE